ncbi:unnamed protein product [Bursaphelenchus xylophilus]|uniref:(pine wood nematode) hypothetical protein n=1 Tax=Bursaphelenchus xylophilus TaxID=6326 RepID=A0A1I7RZY6_BURXY|nr:unnamed protein product [Bursaphelenchus xylophilus]CAG9109144.1 unnamed protein product [Bursaphelenchus xylophilus]
MLAVLLWASLASTVFAGHLPTSYSTQKSYEYVLLNAAVFAADPTQCVAKATEPAGSWQVVAHSLDVKCPGSNETCGFLVIRSDVYQQYVIVFRGSYGSQIDDEIFSTFAPRNDFGGGEVHDYFYKAFQATWPYVESAINSSTTSAYDVVVTGYSLGGAQAALTATQIVESGLKTAEKIVVWTFGEPRVGNAAFSKQFDATFKTVYRVINKADFIPHVPPCIAKGLKECVASDLSYYHHSTEVWYPDGIQNLTSTYRISTKPEDPNGSNSLVLAYQLSDHLGYFNTNLQTFGEGNCQ